MHNIRKRCSSYATPAKPKEAAAETGRGMDPHSAARSVKIPVTLCFRTVDAPHGPPRRAPLRIALCLRYNIRIPQSAPMAQWIEQRTSNPSVAGSSPAGRAKGRVLSSEKHHLDSPNQKNLSLYSSISAMQGSIAGFSTTGCPVQPVFPLFESYASGNRLATTSSRTASGASNALPWANIVVSTRSPGR